MARLIRGWDMVIARNQAATMKAWPIIFLLINKRFLQKQLDF